MRISKIGSDGTITLEFNQAIYGPSLAELNDRKGGTGGRLRGLSDKHDQDKEEGVVINGYLTQDQRKVMAINGIMKFTTKNCCTGTIQSFCSMVKSPRRLMNSKSKQNILHVEQPLVEILLEPSEDTKE